jgi:hypothetical protein
MDKPVTIVSGLPRSGTSLMMQMLAAGGIAPLTDSLRQPDESNPRGYFELEAVKKLRSDRSWLHEAPGKAVKIIHLLLRELPTDGSFQYRVLLMQRPMSEVLSSQRAMLARQGKASADDAMLTKVYGAQMAEAERWLAEHAVFAVLPVSHGRLLQQPPLVAGEVNDFLGGQLDTAAMAAAVDPSLHRQRSAPASE